jgi:hypothetical protein
MAALALSRPSHLLLGYSLAQGDKCIHYGWGIRPCHPLGLVLNSFLPVEALKFGTSLILVLLLYDLKNHAIVGSALSVQRFLIINLIEEGYLLIIGYLMIF